MSRKQYVGQLVTTILAALIVAGSVVWAQGRDVRSATETLVFVQADGFEVAIDKFEDGAVTCYMLLDDPTAFSCVK